MEIRRFSAGDVLEMKKSHPCGCNRFKVLFAGSDIKLKCVLCGHEMIVPRIKIEKSIKKVEYSEN